MKLIGIFFIICFISSFFSSCSSANKQKGEPEIIQEKLFDKQEILSLRIHANFKRLFSDTSKTRVYHNAKLFYKNDTFPIQLKIRGNSRKDPDICSFPPLKLQFDSLAALNSIFEGQHKLKLVTHCNSNNQDHEQVIVQEYLLYRIYNLLTTKSFMVRPLKINYIDSLRPEKSIARFGFFIENKHQLAHRHTGTISELPTNHREVEPIHLSRLSMFQFLISNTDWSVTNAHNMKFIHKDGQIFPVPYDFDYAGLINASYALADEELGVDSLTQRKFRGYCREEGEYQLIAQSFREQRKEIERIFENCPELSILNQQKCLNYINNFYEILNDSALFRKHFMEDCR